MRTQTCGEFEIEDLLGHPPEMVEELRERLSELHADGRAGDSGSLRIAPDPKRPGFYEVRGAETTYYIHILPSSGKVLLLAAWLAA
jgi:hypothetical protein